MLYLKLLNQMISPFTDKFYIILLYSFPIIICLYIISFYLIFKNPRSRLSSKVAIIISALIYFGTWLIYLIIIPPSKGPTGATLLFAFMITYSAAYGVLTYLAAWAVVYVFEYFLEVKKPINSYKNSFPLLLVALLILIGVVFLAYQIGLQAKVQQMIDINTVNS